MSYRHSVVLGLAFAAAVLASPSAQQAPPATEVYLAELRPGGGVPPVVLRNAVNISNSPGYDNQPSFLPDSRSVLFSSNRDGKQTDIYRYDIEPARLTQLTHTPEAEYSPTVTPDGRTFSVVRVEADNSQRLWRFDLDGSNPRVILPDVKPVGYHAWIDATHLALFVLGSGRAPATLQIADTATGKAEIAETGIGRSILIRPGPGTVTYVASGPPRMIKDLDPKTGDRRDLVAPIEGSQDLAWMPSGVLVMAGAGGLSTWTPDTGGWKTRLDGAPAGSQPAAAVPSGITRLAVSPDGRWLAFVADARRP